MDDIVVTKSSSAFVTQFVDFLGQQFNIKDLGPLSYFMVLQVTRDSIGLHFMVSSKLASTPLACKVAITTTNGSLLASPTVFHELVGSLQFLTLTRLDISFVVDIVAQYMSSRRTTHLIATKRILRYVKGTLDFGIHLHP